MREVGQEGVVHLPPSRYPVAVTSSTTNPGCHDPSRPDCTSTWVPGVSDGVAAADAGGDSVSAIARS